MTVVRKVYAFGTMKPIDQSYLHSLADLCNVVLRIINFGKNNQTVADTNLFHFVTDLCTTKPVS